MRWPMLVALLIMAQDLVAETVIVRSGEHADFSRLVVQFDKAHEWTFGKTDDGYELRTDAVDDEFDRSEVFNFIPRTRITAVTSPGPGRLSLQVDCACTADAFEIRRGRIVVDIKSGNPTALAVFEQPLPDLPPNRPWTPDTAATARSASNTMGDNPARLASLLRENFARLAPGLDGGFGGGLASDPGLSGNDNRQGTVTADVQLPDTGNDPNPRPGKFPATRIDRLLTDAPMQAIPRPTELPKRRAVSVQNADSTAAILPKWPPAGVQFPTAPDDAQSPRVKAAQASLVEQIGRAAAQGVLQVETTTILPADPSDKPAKPVDKVEVSPRDSQVSMAMDFPDQVRIQTVVDRDATQADDVPATTARGYQCLDDEIFHLSDWGPDMPSGAPLSALRSGLLAEFDLPRSEIVAALVRRYLYLGFGAEAADVLRTFPVELPYSDILQQMAEIMDAGTGVVPGPLASQLSCATSGGLWAVLATKEILPGVDVERKSLLASFSALPAHLRQHLGPVLAETFLATDDIETASAIRDLTARAADNRTGAFMVMEAQIADHEGDPAANLLALGEAVASNSASTPLALAMTIERNLLLGDTVDGQTALLAEAIARENGGTDIGARLNRAAIRAFAADGQISQAFTRIDEAAAAGRLSVSEAAGLASETHLWNAEVSSGGDFLRNLYENWPDLSDKSVAANGALLAITARMLDLGMPDPVQRIYDPLATDLTAAETTMLLRAEIELGRGERILTTPNLMHTKDDLELIARAQLLNGDFDAAASSFQRLELTEIHKSVVWQARDWPAVAKAGSPAQSAIANLILLQNEGDVLNSTGEHVTETSVSAPTLTPIADSNAILSESQYLRQTISELLAPHIQE